MGVGEPLTHHTAQQKFRTFGILNTDCRAVAVAEIELREIAMQVLLAAELVHAPHAALEDREIAFDLVSAETVLGIVADAVEHAAVIGKLLADLPVVPGFVGHENAFQIHVGADNVGDFIRNHLIGMDRTGAAGALIEESNDLHLVTETALGALYARLVADPGFIGQHLATFTAENVEIVVAHGFANAV